MPDFLKFIFAIAEKCIVKPPMYSVVILAELHIVLHDLMNSFEN